MALCAGADVMPVDMGMAQKVPGVLDRSVAPGTKNLAAEPAMSREQAERAIEAGMELVRDFRARGYDILATGRWVSATPPPPARLRGAPWLLRRRGHRQGCGPFGCGPHAQDRRHRTGISVNKPNPEDALDVLEKLVALI
jgi:nicotinate-nucleotide--dimethylbenzimidazole phosphoribosyltransferase